MFRLVAAALVSTFLLLGALSSEGPLPQQATVLPTAVLTGLADTARARVAEGVAPTDGSLRVVQSQALPLLAEPDADSEILAVLNRGMAIELLGEDGQGYLQVRDQAGRVGYLTTEQIGDQVADQIATPRPGVTPPG
ncbi:SH3 domain-containing protein [Paracoccus sphaerophysae]|uniref:SH3b domain-containing protein n=1 Tax=Paracoccus sphaerophysae TaxID=690417 RepID=A0A099EW07_9RHOB|nr:SH3 domain-containing protein [Paracoccus sphaerophysae]KGJ02550.1 hypothetical protein IC63_14570 [Paracoccus sphaerophysae]